MQIIKLSRSFRHCFLSCLVFIFCASPAPLYAQTNDSTGLFNSFTYTTQNTGSNGLVNSKVYAIHEDKSGAIWFGTEHKLGRYYKGVWEIFLEDDGWDRYEAIWEKDSADVNFINYMGLMHFEGEEAQHLHQSNTPNLLPYIHSSYVDAEGVIWLTGSDYTGEGYKIIKNRGEGWEEVNSLKLQDLDLEQNWIVNSMLVQKNGEIWLSTSQNLLYFDGHTWHKMYNRFSGPAKYRFAEDKHGKLLLINGEGIYSYEAGAFSEILQQGGSSNLEIDQEGVWWFGDDNGNLYKWNEETITSFVLPNPLTAEQTDQVNTINVIRQVSDGSLYIGTALGVWHLTNLDDPLDGASQFSTFDGLPSNNVKNVFQDKKGLYWYSTDAGLSTFDGQNWQFISQLLKVHMIDQDGAVWCSKGPSHEFFAGYKTITVYDGESWRDFSSDGIGVDEITAIAQTPDGRIWVAGLTGIAVWDGFSWQKSFHDEGFKVYKLFADSKGVLWFDYYQENPRDPDHFGLGYYKDEQLHFFGEDELMSNVYVNKIMEDRQGYIWFATYNHGLIRINEQESDPEEDVFSVGTANLLDNFISTVAEDAAGGIWAVYDFNLGLGASRFDGTSWTHYNTQNGLPTNKIKDFYINTPVVKEEGGGARLLSSSGSKAWISSEIGLTVLDLKFNTSGEILGIGGLKERGIVQFYPNPTTDQLSIRFKTAASARLVQLTDLQGRVMMQEYIGNIMEVHLSMKALPNGLYLLRINDAQHTTTYKVLKQ